MNRRNAAVVSAFLALAVVLGAASMLRTTHLGASAASATSAAQIRVRNRQLDRVEAALRKAAAQRPPALPALPAGRPSPAAAPAPAARVVYVRPAPVVHVVHRHGEHEDGEGGEGGGLDD